MNILNTTEQIKLQDNQTAKIVPFKPASTSNAVSKDSAALDSKINEKNDGLKPELAKKTEENNFFKDKRNPAEKEEEAKKEELTQKTLDEISQDIETLHSVGLSFSKHKESGRTIVKVVNKDTDEIIREIPAEEVLNMAEKMDEMLGLLFDKKV